MRQIKVRILENEKITENFYKMRIESPYLARNIKPGQFIHVRCSDGTNPLLRRPFSVHKISKDGVEILYEVVGRGTETLSQRKRDEYLDVIGPVGVGFDLNAIRYPLNAILVAGGMGVAPLLALAEQLKNAGNKIHVIIGAKTKNHILCEREFKSLGCAVKIATDDGSKGIKGVATDLLKDTIYAIRHRPYATIYACGPNSMLKEVARLAKVHNVPCQVSLEEYMACGVGVCLGCPVKVRNTTHDTRHTNHEYKMVCKDGPVFNAEDVIWQ